MFEPVTLPWWLFGGLALLAGVALTDRLVLPGLRWYLRRKVTRVVEELNARLRIKLPAFKLIKREVLIDRLLHDGQVVETAEAHMREEMLPREMVMSRIERYVREIVPSFNAYVYFRIGCGLAKAFAQFMYRVRLTFADDVALVRIEPRSTIVFVMNHRSNMDYVLVAFLVADQAALSYAVGEWARVWPLQQILRAMGAFFIRRNSNNPLYRRVLERYVQMAAENGVSQAMFPEGGLSKDGVLRPPKLGLFDYLCKGFDPKGERDMVFIPVGINYDRVIEDRSLLRSLDPEAAPKGLLAVVTTSLTFIANNLWLMARGRWRRFGYACVNIGVPVSVRDYCIERGIDFRNLDKAERFPEVATLADIVMEEVGRAVPVLPVSLLATVFLSHGGDFLSEYDLKAQTHALLDRLDRLGAHLQVPRQDQDAAVTWGLRMLVLRRLVDANDEGLYMVVEENRHVLKYYANALAHHWAQEQRIAAAAE